MNDDMMKEISKDSQGKDKFIFKHYEKFGDEEFETKQSIDVNGIEDDDEARIKVIQGFLRFLLECGWQAEEILEDMILITEDAELLLIEEELESHPLTKGDEEFKMFLQKLNQGQPEFLKEVYEAHRGLQSLN